MHLYRQCSLTMEHCHNIQYLKPKAHRPQQQAEIVRCKQLPVVNNGLNNKDKGMIKVKNNTDVEIKKSFI